MAPKLPDSTVFGDLPSGRSGRPMSSIDASPIGEAMQQFSRAGMRVGNQFAAIGQEFQAKAERDATKDADLVDSQNRSNYLVAKLNLDAQRDKETDPEKLAEYPKQYQALQEKYASAYANDPVRQQKFNIAVADDIAKANIRTDQLRTSIDNDRFKAGALDTLENLRQSGLQATDEDAKKKVTEQAMEQFRLLREKGIITNEQEVTARRQWVQNYAIDSLKMLPAEQRLQALGGWQEALKLRESSGNPGVVNKFGYAGLYQFGAPRLETLGVYQPGANEDLKDWSQTGKAAPGKWSGTFNIPGFPGVRTVSDFLANPDAQEAVFQIHRAKMDQEITSQGLDKYIGQTVGGVPITREGIYAMMHLGGAGGAALALRSGGVINGKDANNTSLLDYAKMGAAGPSKMVAFIPPDKQKELRDSTFVDVLRQAQQSAQQQQAFQQQQLANQQSQINDLEVGLHDGTKTRADILAARQSGLLTDYDQIKKVESIADAKEKEGADLRAFQGAVTTPGFQWNPIDKEHKDAVEAGFEATGRDVNALQWIAQKTNMVPASGVVALRGAIASNDPKRAKTALTVAANLTRDNPNIFAGTDGGDHLALQASTFRHYVDKLAYGADEATKKILEEQAPEYQQTVKARVKAEDVDKIVKTRLSPTDLSKAFNDGLPVLGRPNVEFTPEARREAMGDYEELFRDRFGETGDVDKAKAQAIDQMKRIWGVSRVNGSGVLTRYPPDRAPVYAGIENVSDLMAAEAISRIKENTGQDIDRKSLIVTAIPRQTETPYKSGEVPPFAVAWLDKNGHMQVAQGVMQFDPDTLRKRQTADRASAMGNAMHEADPGLQRGQAYRDVKQKLRDEARQRILDTRKQVEE